MADNRGAVAHRLGGQESRRGRRTIAATGQRLVASWAPFHQNLCNSQCSTRRAAPATSFTWRSGASEGARGRGAGPARRSATAPNPLNPRRAYGRTPPTPRHRGEPARQGDRRAGVVDRLPAMALPDLRQRRCAEPVLRNYKNIECRDALLSWRAEEWVRGPDRRPLTRSGRADPQAAPGHRRTGSRRKRAGRGCGGSWARSRRNGRERILLSGIPPFVGAKYLRELLGDGYAEARWRIYRQMPQSADYVMYWWHRAAEHVAAGRTRRFGFITTNSLPASLQPPGRQGASGGCRRHLAGLRDPQPSLGRGHRRCGCTHFDDRRHQRPG